MGESQLVRVVPAPIYPETRECTQPKACKRTIRKRVVENRWLFNNIHVGEVLIDCRSRQRFLANTVIDVVLFADKEDVTNPDSWLHQLETFLIEEALVITVKMLCGGFSKFQRRYPFYTTLGIVGDGVLQCGQYHVAYPNEIIDRFLFLGNMWQAQSKQVFQDLGITHVVNATLDVGNVFEDDGVKYFNAKLLDKPEANITQFFEAACQFIAEASQSTTADGKPCRVFVHCTQGISRSATLVIVYVMRVYHWSLAQAFNFTRSGRGVIIPNEGFLRALVEEERRLFRHKCSVTEDELELLVSPLGFSLS
ncbi:hypothetical protein JM18_007355 [Phytophthora kernoviae]|uniref:protein-tyrosine-phosphatase n=2 Tax=Phytophthora kernoviae TaxID=325452 RepID=A0A921SDJ1_9STRA|nr:hypothetical protein G195_008479 [Phytophthora kernoviae 00238/432]KAG2520009.1 hypothetical protein JM18_007355 [Phytophthora kernoviae]